jgi:hypothetical protein
MSEKQGVGSNIELNASKRPPHITHPRCTCSWSRSALLPRPLSNNSEVPVLVHSEKNFYQFPLSRLGCLHVCQSRLWPVLVGRMTCMLATTSRTKSGASPSSGPVPLMLIRCLDVKPQRCGNPDLNLSSLGL